MSDVLKIYLRFNPAWTLFLLKTQFSHIGIVNILEWRKNQNSCKKFKIALDTMQYIVYNTHYKDTMHCILYMTSEYN